MDGGKAEDTIKVLESLTATEQAPKDPEQTDDQN